MQTSEPGVKQVESNVVISVDWPEASATPASFVWLRPSDLNWNDFGHVTRAIIGFVQNGNLVFEYRGKAAYLDSEQEKYIGVGNAVRQLSKDGVILTDSRSVISLADSQETYRMIIREAGVEIGNERLLARIIHRDEGVLGFRVGSPGVTGCGRC